MAYDPLAIEKKWQKFWEENKTFAAKDKPSLTEAVAPSAGRPGNNRKKCYVLEQFPYPSGRLHMGHLRLYTLGDVLARYKSAQGFEVMHPMGWDAFGLPAENAAIENKINPAKWTYQNIGNMRKQLKQVGLSYDWERELATCDPEYYKHEQKMFLDFLSNGIAYRKESLVNWDPVDNTVLANEQVIEGRGWRSGALVERKKLTQWFLKITDFANDLLDGLKTLPDWPERVLTMQEKWIGKSEGALIRFQVSETRNQKPEILVYTTRPDTIFGASFIAIAANHPIALELSKSNMQIQEFVEECSRLGVAEEAIEKAEKKGFDTGLKALHPFKSDILLPIYIANFVLMDYGTGALFGCPAHDERDYEFAQKYNLPIKTVVEPKNREQAASRSRQPGASAGAPTENLGKFSEERPKINLPYTEEGVAVNSGFLDGLSTSEAKSRAITELVKLGTGERKINYRLRDWGISRQRYWGCPIPIIYCDKCGVVPVPEKDLPVKLPDDPSFDKPGNPLDHHPTWKNVKCPACGIDARRETDTFDTFIDSSWYYARFCSPKSDKAFEKDEVESWLPVDYYLGGIEHAVLHLLYSRFFCRALAKCGYTDIEEPFKGLLTQGMVCRETYKDEKGNWIYPEEVVRSPNGLVHKDTGMKVTVGRSEKMSKSKKNVVSPEAILEKYGADTARLFMLSDSPPERDLEWSDAGVEGSSRYLHKLWRMAEEYKDVLRVGQESNTSLEPAALRPTEMLGNISGDSHKIIKLAHKTIASITDQLEKFQLNSAVAKIREFSNAIADLPEAEKPAGRAAFEILIRLFYPMAPHIAEEIWEVLGHKTPLAKTAWPKADKSLIVDDTVVYAIQVNGKLRGTLEVGASEPDESAKKKALEMPQVANSIAGKEIRKIIFVPKKIINIVI